MLHNGVGEARCQSAGVTGGPSEWRRSDRGKACSVTGGKGAKRTHCQQQHLRKESREIVLGLRS